MCLLIALFRVHPDAPLILAANRDEWLARAATPMETLQTEPFHTIGGRDRVAGGTWLAVNEAGVVAALTNRPPATLAAMVTPRRSRGELPVFLTRHRTAREAAAAFAREVDPSDYNRCWLLVGDRSSLHYIDLGDPTATTAVPRELEPGIHVLENNPLGAESPKERAVTTAVASHSQWRGRALDDNLWRVLASHEVPDLSGLPPAAPGSFERLPETQAPCVHAGPYGTRWSGIVRVPVEPARMPDVHYAEGTPCKSAAVSADTFWRAA